MNKAIEIVISSFVIVLMVISFWFVAKDIVQQGNAEIEAKESCRSEYSNMQVALVPIKCLKYFKY